MVIKGKAASPVYLWINGRKVEIRDASKIWGETTSATDREVKKDLGEPKAKVACIGPAGERLVRFASVVNEHGNAGRCGLDAVMGSKNLKAVAVRGTRQVEVAKPEETNEYSKTLFKRYHDATVNTLHKHGTAAVKKYYDRGYGITRNWREWMFEGVDGIDGNHLPQDR